MSLARRVAPVTGAQQGIGAAVVVALGAQGATVMVNYLDDEPAAAGVVASIEAGGWPSRSDPRRRPLPSRRYGDGRSRRDPGGVELLINNAGTFLRVPFLQMADEQWSTVLEVNLAGTFRCTQVVARRMAQAGKPGAVVNLASVDAYRGSPLGTRINEVTPGLTDTAQPRAGLSEAEIAKASAPRSYT